MTDPVPADLRPELLQTRLETERFGRSLEVHAETGSTMDDARAQAGTAADGHVVLADRQTRGRGAHGRHWESPGGVDLYFSVLSRARLTPSDRPLVTLAIGLGVAEAAETLVGTPARIKWPNDVWLRGRKCAGVLVETGTRGDAPEPAILGVGLDVNRRRWPPELEDEAISLAQARGDGKDLDRAEALARTLEAMERWLDRLAAQGTAPIVDAVGRRLALVGEVVVVDTVRGVLEGVTDAGAARVRTPDGHRDVLAGTLRKA